MPKRPKKRRYTTPKRRPPPKAKDKWSPQELTYLRRSWGERLLITMAKKLRRTEGAVYTKARQLGLECGPPQGFISLREAIRRSGYSRDYLMNIFKAHGVTVEVFKTSRKGALWPKRMVDEFDAAQAVRAHMALELETVIGAATRLRKCPSAMSIAARMAGLATPGRNTKLPSAKWEELVASPFYKLAQKEKYARDRRTRLRREAAIKVASEGAIE